MTTAPTLLRPALRSAVERAAEGRDCVVVGGFTRDALLGRPAPDLDLAVAADARVVADRLGALLGGAPFPLGAEHGVYRVAFSRPVEGISHIDVAALRGTVAGDLSLRDFTVNAIAWDVYTGAIVDPFDGAGALARRTLRLVSDGAVRADPLRALRAVRFVAELGFAIDPGAAAVIRRDATLVAGVAGERIRDELMRVLDQPRSAASLRLADALGVLDAILPELIPAKGCAQPKEHYFDVFDHLIATVAVMDALLGSEPEEAVWAQRVAVLWSALPDGMALRAGFDAPCGGDRTRRSLLKLTALLHDVSKPETKAVQPDGRVRFFGHDDLGAAVTEAILTRLRLTTRETRYAVRLVKDHLRPGQLSNGRSLPTRRALYRFFRDLDDAAPDLLLLNLADHAAARGPLMPDDDWAGHVADVRWILEQRRDHEELVHPPRLITGNDLMAELGLAPGPLLGRLLSAVREAQAAGRVTTREEALRLASRLARVRTVAPAAPAEG